MKRLPSVLLPMLFIVCQASKLLLAQQMIAYVSGVEKYDKDGFQRLNFAEDDALELKVELVKLGFRVTDVIGADATLAGMQKKLNAFLLQTKALQKSDIVVMFFSGHGFQKKVSSKTPDGKPIETEEPFFCPVDALKSDAKTLLSLNEVLRRLDEDSGSSNNLLMLDACRESADKSGKGIDGSTIEKLPKKLALLFAAQSGHISFESRKLGHGIFTYYLLEGLRGRARDEDDEITLLGLSNYVSARVQKMSPELLDVSKDEAQVPNFMGNLSGTIVLSRVDTKRTVPTDNPDSPPTKKEAANGTISGSRLGEVRSANSVGMKLVWIPGGSFTMGSPPNEKDRQQDENQVSVKLTEGFWLGQTEVTQGQWKSLMGTEPWKGQSYVKDGANYAASYISLEDAESYVKKLTIRERESGVLPLDWEYALPTEAQWEYACRAGTKTSYSFGDNDEDLSQYGWWGGMVGDGNATAEQYAHEVGKKLANPAGLYDMHGNVWEWCRDDYVEKLLGGTNPKVPNEGADRVNRGGVWSDDARSCRSAWRSWDWPDDRYSGLGFRISLVPAGK